MNKHIKSFVFAVAWVPIFLVIGPLAYGFGASTVYILKHGNEFFNKTIEGPHSIPLLIVFVILMYLNGLVGFDKSENKDPKRNVGRKQL